MYDDESEISQSRLVRLSIASGIVEKITGERPHTATLARWASRGLAGCRLRTAYAGGYRRTTENWIREFFDAVTVAKSGGYSSTEPCDGIEDESTEQALDDAGI